MAEPLYKNRKEVDVKNSIPGYTMRALITPLAYINVFPQVVGNAEVGNRLTIDDSIEYVADRGSVVVMCAPASVEGDGELIGESLAMRFKHTPKLVLIGDDAATRDLVLRIANEKFLLHVEKPECSASAKQYFQFGNQDEPCLVVKGSFKSGKTGDGRTQYEFEFEAYDKYDYNGVLTEMPEA